MWVKGLLFRLNLGLVWLWVVVGCWGEGCGGASGGGRLCVECWFRFLVHCGFSGVVAGGSVVESRWCRLLKQPILSGPDQIQPLVPNWICSTRVDPTRPETADPLSVLVSFGVGISSRSKDTVFIKCNLNGFVYTY
ncbi:hypothetical protein GQ457_04G009330 [Hibiscus cannabinus]